LCIRHIQKAMHAGVLSNALRAQRANASGV
jgi:hypothetical protein